MVGSSDETTIYRRTDYWRSQGTRIRSAGGGNLPAPWYWQSTLYKWKAKYGGKEINDARKLKALEDENTRLKRLLAHSLLDNQMLRDINSSLKSFEDCMRLNWRGVGFDRRIIKSGEVLANQRDILTKRNLCKNRAPSPYHSLSIAHYSIRSACSPGCYQAGISTKSCRWPIRI